jgi:hypothetical protein
MSSSDQAALAAANVLNHLSQPEAEPLSPQTIRAVVSAAARLYAKAVEDAGGEIPPVEATLATTEAITLSCALLRSQNLTPFDMALWFSREVPSA